MTNLFTTLAPFIKGSELSFTLKKKGEQITVSVMPKGELIDDEDNHIVPLIITGTAEELDKDFVATIIKPLEKAVGIVTNLEDFEAAVEKTAEENKPTPKAKTETKAAAPKVDTKKIEADAKKLELEEKKKADAERKRIYDELMKRASSFEKEKLVRECIGTLNEAKNFNSTPGQLTLIVQRIDKLMVGIKSMGILSQEGLDELKAFKSNIAEILSKPEEVATPPVVEPAASETNPDLFNANEANPNPEEPIEPVVENPAEKGEQS